MTAGCSAPTGETDDAAQAASELASKLTPAELARTKQALRALANANMNRTDNAAEIRAQAQPLVDKLARHFGARSAQQKLPLVQGAWRQLWTDFPYPMTSFLTMDPSQVYQVVSASGHYWNIGDEKALGFVGLTGVLRGAFTPSGTKINLQFTNIGFRFGRLSKGDDLVALADGLESGDRFYLPLPGGGKAPNGPVGIKGTLETLYVDADLRVDQGTQEDFLDASGAVAVPGYGPKLFILDRVQLPVK
jgi:hypothetical protein